MIYLKYKNYDNKEIYAKEGSDANVYIIKK